MSAVIAALLHTYESYPAPASNVTEPPGQILVELEAVIVGESVLDVTVITSASLAVQLFCVTVTV